MAERSASLLTEREYEAGTVIGQAIPVDDDVTHFVVWFDRTPWVDLPGVAVSVVFWRSEDSGKTWLRAGESSTHGGRIIGDGGNEYLMTKWAMTLPPGRGRQVKVDVEVHRQTRVKADVDLIIRTESTRGIR